MNKLPYIITMLIIGVFFTFTCIVLASIVFGYHHSEEAHAGFHPQATEGTAEEGQDRHEWDHFRDGHPKIDAAIDKIKGHGDE